jgi:two-component system, NarL family, response regulator
MTKPKAKPDADALAMPANDTPLRLRVLITDDHTALRIGLSAIIDSMDDAVVVGEAADGDEAVTMYQTVRPDIMTLDLRMPKLDGLRVVEQVLATSPDARILVITMYDNEEDIFNSIRAGAKGYILKSAPRAEIIAALRKVGAGERYLPDYVAATIATRLSTPCLTMREKQVLQLMRMGLSNKDIARQISVSEGTVKAHVREILRKLEAISRTEAVNLALQRGILN